MARNLPASFLLLVNSEVKMPNTIGVILLFAVVFAGGILWATRGHTADAEGMGDVTGHPGKMS
jgi:hypothetical protein